MKRYKIVRASDIEDVEAGSNLEVIEESADYMEIKEVAIRLFEQGSAKDLYLASYSGNHWQGTWPLIDLVSFIPPM